jgi:hypothetical protein
VISFAILLDVSHAYDVVLASSSFSFSDATVETFLKYFRQQAWLFPHCLWSSYSMIFIFVAF